MKIQKEYKLQTLFQNAQREFYRSPIQVSIALVGIIVLLLPILSALWLKVVLPDPITNFLSLTIEVNLSSIMLSLILLVWALYLLHKIAKQNYDKDSTFIDYGGVSWKIITLSDKTTHIDFPSYCIKHHVQHTQETHNYVCLICGVTNLPAIPYFFKEMKIIYDAVKSSNGKKLS
jgi:hypothetical protein